MIKQSTFLRRALKALIADGWTLRAVDVPGEAMTKVSTVSEAIKEVAAVDSAVIRLLRNRQQNVASDVPVEGDERGWILAVWQGPDATYKYGEEIISDHSTNLSAVLDPLYDARPLA